ncbi:hypothetical protein F5X96DRAFT_672551 [Biscogniauxia mediterranea]|nr:hypothetical protein F5X96DRAFT_672551 [Biscogniauxia mediterranea]
MQKVGPMEAGRYPHPLQYISFPLGTATAAGGVKYAFSPKGQGGGVIIWANCSFDIFPPIEETSAGKGSYRCFLEVFTSTYNAVYDEEGQSEDCKVLQAPTDSPDPDTVYIYFMISECPYMPRNPDRCDYFLRFQLQVRSADKELEKKTRKGGAPPQDQGTEKPGEEKKEESTARPV